MQVVAGVDIDPVALKTFAQELPGGGGDRGKRAVGDGRGDGVRLSVFGVGRENAEGVRLSVIAGRLTNKSTDVVSGFEGLSEAKGAPLGGAWGEPGIPEVRDVRTWLASPALVKLRACPGRRGMGQPAHEHVHRSDQPGDGGSDDSASSVYES